MVYNVKDIAAYIVDYSIENGCPVSNLKLQKLLYYVQAYFLVTKSEPCFREDIEHWRHGPVVREVYSQYKMYFDDKITKSNGFNGLGSYDKKLIDKVIDSYETYGPWDMVRKTHEEEPWVNTNSDDVIDKKEIKKYFNKHKSYILG
ncbi:Panacea domain-containing protein [Clostridium perfringens]|uniref:Panacea domain-containing protein n=1 Tax=Clostridium perfringens TaxID=1502 RepID=UPI000DA2E86A|nr:type II toxin-antitoxin system antitoxin SocA domain-containing protein [Clostridium perfringens]MDM0495266.1 DUF4065 domain-containing protein [Clostridium perfringens]SQI01971.1 putative phage-associated protein [Clostridium perfringens]